MAPPGAQSGGVLSQMMRGFAPMTTTRVPNMSGPFAGTPLAGNPVLSMFLTSRLQDMMGARGMQMFGLNSQNIADAMRAREFQGGLMQVMRQTTDEDVSNYMRTFRGLAAMTGTPFGADQIRAARGISQQLGQATPALAMRFPDLIDQLSGMRGSATVMAQRMFTGGRNRIDPVTGRMGLEPETVEAMTERVREDLFRDENLRDMRGITAGELGGLFQGLQQRGMIAQGPDDPGTTEIRRTARSLRRQDPAAFEQALEGAGINPEERNLQDLTKDELQRLGEQAPVLRQFDSEQVKRTLENYTGAVAAVRDIFGDMGQPNAPMQQLVTALDALTQGGLGQLDPKRMQRMVRETRQLSRMAGMSMDQMLATQQHAANQAQQMGLPAVFAPELAQGAAGFGGAFRARGLGAHRAFGRMDAEEFQQLDLNLRTQAAGSETANRLAAAVRISEAAGGFEEGTTARRMVEAIRRGDTEFGTEEGTRSLADIDRGEMIRILSSRPGVTEQTAASAIANRTANERAIFEENIQDTVRRMQPERAREVIRQQAQQTLASRFETAGMDREAATQAARQATEGLAADIQEMDPATLADPQDRQEAIGRMIQQRLPDDVSLTDRESRLAAQRLFAGTTRQIQRDPRLRHFENAMNMIEATRPSTLAAGRQMQQAAQVEAEVADELAGLGQGSMLRRAVSYLQRNRDERGEGEDPNITGMIASALGGIDKDRISGGLQTAFQDVTNQLDEIRELQGKYQQAEPGSERARELRGRLDERVENLRPRVQRLRERAAEQGIFTGTHLDPSRIEDVGEYEERLGELQMEEKGEGVGLIEKSRSRIHTLEQQLEGADTAAERERTQQALADERERLESLRTERDNLIESREEAATEVASGLLHDPAAALKLGPEAFERSEEIRDIREQKLAMARRRGFDSVAELHAAAQDDKELRNRLRELDERRKALLTDVRLKLNAEGPQWADGGVERIAKNLLSEDASQERLETAEERISAAQELFQDTGNLHDFRERLKGDDLTERERKARQFLETLESRAAQERAQARIGASPEAVMDTFSRLTLGGLGRERGTGLRKALQTAGGAALAQRFVEQREALGSLAQQEAQDQDATATEVRENLLKSAQKAVRDDGELTREDLGVEAEDISDEQLSRIEQLARRREEAGLAPGATGKTVVDHLVSLLRGEATGKDKEDEEETVSSVSTLHFSGNMRGNGRVEGTITAGANAKG